MDIRKMHLNTGIKGFRRVTEKNYAYWLKRNKLFGAAVLVRTTFFNIYYKPLSLFCVPKTKAV